MATKKWIYGLLALVILTTSAYIIFNNSLKINVTNTSTTFYVNESGIWNISGVEYNTLYYTNGTIYKPIKIKVSTFINQTTHEAWIYRTANYSQGQSLIDTYYFQGDNKEKENFPVRHYVTITNLNGTVYEYKVNKLSYSGPNLINVKSPQSFGKNMKVEWQDGYYFSSLKKLSTGGQLIVRYNITSNQQDFIVRLFDPVNISKNSLTWNDIALRDDTNYSSDGSCIAQHNGMKVYLPKCTVGTMGGKDIKVDNVNFTTNRTEGTTYIFAYEGALEDAHLYWYHNYSHAYKVTNQIDQYVNNYLVTDVYNYTILGNPNSSCQLGNSHNSKMYYVNQNRQTNGTAYPTIYCFSTINTVNSTAFRISGNITIDDISTITGFKLDYDDISNIVTDITSNVPSQLQKNFTFYKIENVNPGSYQISWMFTPKNQVKSGKFHILAYPTSKGIVQSYIDGDYMYQDPAWNSTFEQSLISYNNFDTSAPSNTTYTRDVYRGYMNMTVVSATTTTNGKNNQAYNYTGTNYLNTGYKTYLTTEPNRTNWAMNVWIKPSSDFLPGGAILWKDGRAGMGTFILWLGQGASNPGRHYEVAYSNVWILTTTNVLGCPLENNYCNATANTWSMITVSQNSSGMFMFINGTLQASLSTIWGPTTYLKDKNVSYIGKNGNYWSTAYWSGLVDEYSVYNRSLTSDDVVGLWNGGSGIFYSASVADTIYPLFSNNISSPASPSTYASGMSYNFNATILNTNGTAFFEFGGTNYTVTNFTTLNFNITLTDLKAGSYNYFWHAYGNGTSKLFNKTDTSTYIVSNMTTTVTMLLNGSSANTLNLTSIQQLNSSVYCSNTSANLYRNGILDTANISIYRNLSAGYYNFSAYCSGNENYTASSITKYVNVTQFLASNISFISQIPVDIDTLNAVASGVNLSYSFTNGTLDNFIAYYIFSKVNTSTSDCFSFVNGTNFQCGFGFHLPVYNITRTNYTAHLDDNDVYPASYNFNQEQMETNTKLDNSLNNANALAKIELLNISNTKASGYFEFSVVNASASSIPTTIRACNSSYTTGSPTTSANCLQIYTINVTSVPNHYHFGLGDYVAQFVINTTNGKMNNQLYVTKTMQFVIGGGTNWNFKYISNYSRSGAAQTSSNHGVSWSELSGTFDAHIHQYDGTETLWYYALGTNSTYNNITTDYRSDLLQLSGLPPTSPNVFSPLNQTYYNNTRIDINWTNSYSLNGYTISSYTVVLLNPSGSVNRSIVNLGGTMTNYSWSSNTTTVGAYIIGVSATDNIGQVSVYGMSQQFDLETYVDVNVPTFSSNITNPLSPIVYASGGIYSFNLTSTYNNGTVWIEFGGVNYSMTNFTLTQYNITFVDLKANNYNYYYWAFGNGSFRNFNKTDTSLYNITQATITSSILLNGTNATTLNLTYPGQFNASASCTSGTLKLWHDGLDDTANNNIFQNVKVGYYNLTTYCTGNENYSDSSITKYVNISKGSQSITYLLNGVNNLLNVIYPAQINASYTGTNQTTLIINVSNTRNFTLTPGLNYSIEAGIFKVNFTMNSNENWSQFSDNSTFTINKAQTQVKTYLGSVNGNNNVNVGFSIILNGSLLSGKFVNLNLSLEGIQKNYSTTYNLTYNYLATGAQRNAIVNISYSGNENYSHSSESWTLGINSHVPALNNQIELPSTPVTYSPGQTYNFNVTIADSADDIKLVKLMFNGTNYTASNYSDHFTFNVTITDLRVGSYNFSWWVNDSNNYANMTTQRTYVINQATPSLTLSVLPSTIVTQGTQTNITGFGCLSTFTCQLSSNNVTFTNPNISILGLGSYYWKYNTTGNENYSAYNTPHSLLTVTSDSIYPIFSSYSDNNNTLIDNGFGTFNVTILNSNGTVYFNINGTSTMVTNYSYNKYNIVYVFNLSGNYPYNWTSYGNGTNHNFNISNTLIYTVKTQSDPCVKIIGQDWIYDNINCIISIPTDNNGKSIYLQNGSNLTISSNFTIKSINIYGGSSLIRNNGNYIFLY